jgi:hypothetical protein
MNPQKIRSYLWIGFLAILIKVTFLAVGVWSLRQSGIVPNFCAWDCGYYEKIFLSGYDPPQDGRHGTLAFFPVFPYLLRGLHFLIPTLSFPDLAILMNLVFYGLCCAGFARWSYLVGLRLWWLPTLLWIFDRTTFWPLVPYTESLFVFLISNLKSPLKELSLAILGGAASGVRMVGVSLGAAAFWGQICLWRRKPILVILCGVISLLGVLVFFGWCHFQFGNWKASLDTTAQWGRHFSLFGLWESIKVLFLRFYFPTLLIGVATLIGIFWKFPTISITATEKWLFGFLMFIPMASSIQISLTRYLSVLLLGYVVSAHGLGKLNTVLRNTLILIFVTSESYWQIHLFLKFLKFEAFNWAA